MKVWRFLGLVASILAFAYYLYIDVWIDGILIVGGFLLVAYVIGPLYDRHRKKETAHRAAERQARIDAVVQAYNEAMDTYQKAYEPIGARLNPGAPNPTEEQRQDYFRAKQEYERAKQALLEVRQEVKAFQESQRKSARLGHD